MTQTFNCRESICTLRDLTQLGQSTPMPRHFPWTLDIIIDDYCQLMNALAIARFDLVEAQDRHHASPHRSGPRAGAMGGGEVGSSRWARTSRTASVSVMNAMIRQIPANVRSREK